MNLRPRKRNSPVIPIVALVDILIITLLFIVATTTFRKSKPKTQVQINLPQSSGLGSTTPSKEVRKTLAITQDRKVVLDGTEVADADLAAALKRMKDADPTTKLELQADQDTPLGMLVKVWDALKIAGFPINDVPARIQRAAQAAGAPGA
ncbi:MAG: hypothetical protein RL693_2871 [Verrucomicrobiota bacterium]|jgi:biopolymer transport protein ExbD